MSHHDSFIGSSMNTHYGCIRHYGLEADNEKLPVCFIKCSLCVADVTLLVMQLGGY